MRCPSRRLPPRSSRFLAGLKLRAEDCVLRREIDLLLAAPARFYDEHAHWPSSLADSVPIELSLAIDERGRASFRFTGDLADHRRPLAANLPHYVESARHLTGAAVPTLREVFGSHIDPRGYRAGTAAYHGAGYGRGGARRSTIYFAIGWFPAARFEARFAREVAALDADFLKVGGRRPRRYHGVSYDFDAGVPHRKKFYGWVDLGASGSPANLLGQRRDLTAAGALLTRLLAKGPPADPERALMLHSSVTGTPARCRQKAFFQCNEWSLDAPRAFLDLVLDVSSFCDIDLSPLTVVFDVLTGRGLQLLPTWFAIGADGATFCSDRSIRFEAESGGKSRGGFVARRSISCRRVRRTARGPRVRASPAKRSPQSRRPRRSRGYRTCATLWRRRRRG